MLARPENHLNSFQHAIEAGEFTIKVAQARTSDLIHAHAPVGRGRNGPLAFDQLLF
jgi:hypothetical protein